LTMMICSAGNPVAEKAKPRRIQVSAPTDQIVIEASPVQSDVAGGGAS
jgi:hypothetical protein